MLNKIKIHLTYTRIIAIGFFFLILFGTILLMLPVSSQNGSWTSFTDALFTSTSATAVTGLVIFDTFSNWTLFGQLVILILIQIGGIGFMTVITIFSMFLKRNIGIHERILLTQSAGSIQIGGIVRLIRRISVGTFLIEGIGALFLAIRFCPLMGFWEGIYNAIFHSISAFCNAGFDIMGKYGHYSSLTTFKDDILVNFIIVFLVITGGIGFIVWNDILKNRFKFKAYLLHSKIVLSVTLFLIVTGTILFFIFESNGQLQNESLGNKFLMSLFQSVTTRTAGFNTLDTSALSESGSLLTTIFMFIGGSPGSTAGGIKTTTFLVLILGTISSARNKNAINIFKKRLDDSVIRQASAIFTIYIGGVLTSTLIISTIQSFPLQSVFFETVSAIGTVGLSTGITPDLNIVSKFIIILLMYGGRIGGLTLAMVLAEKRTRIPVERPSEKILIG